MYTYIERCCAICMSSIAYWFVFLIIYLSVALNEPWIGGLRAVPHWARHTSRENKWSTNLPNAHTCNKESSVGVRKSGNGWINGQAQNNGIWHSSGTCKKHTTVVQSGLSLAVGSWELMPEDWKTQFVDISWWIKTNSRRKCWGKVAIMHRSTLWIEYKVGFTLKKASFYIQKTGIFAPIFITSLGLLLQNFGPGCPKKLRVLLLVVECSAKLNFSWTLPLDIPYSAK